MRICFRSSRLRRSIDRYCAWSSASRSRSSSTPSPGAGCYGRRSLLTFQSQESTLSLAVVPIGEMLEAPAAEPATLVVFGRHQVCEPLSVEFFAREHRLTTAETAVLRGLSAGLRPAQIACEAGIAISTVRSHIASMRVKTRAKSIGDLLRLVTVLPPIVPVLAW